MLEAMRLSELQLPLSGRLVGADASFSAVSTDSRAIQPGQLFIALTGPRFDGHAYLAEVAAKGAVAALVAREVEGAPLPQLVVADTRLALGRLGALNREAFKGPVAAITGSSGKTSVKEMLASILRSAHGHDAVLATRGNLNNDLGAPLTLLELSAEHRSAVIELGASRVGDIAYTVSLVRPDVSLITNAGTAHVGEFGGPEKIVQAKGEILDGLSATGTAVLNRDDKAYPIWAERVAGKRIVSFGLDNPLADFSAGSIAYDQRGCPNFVLTGPLGNLRVQLNLLGRHNVANALAAAAAAHAAGMDPAEIARGLDGLGPASRFRMERTDRADGVTIINDAYNANPESMRAALRTLATLGRSSGRRTWAVLGEMLELGDARVREHTLVGESVVRLNIAQLLVVGAGARPLYIGALNEGSWGEEAHFVDDAAQAEAFLAEHLRPGDLVLVKSSNGVGLAALGERLATADAVAAPSASPKESRP